MLTRHLYLDAWCGTTSALALESSREGVGPGLRGMLGGAPPAGRMEGGCGAREQGPPSEERRRGDAGPRGASDSGCGGAGRLWTGLGFSRRSEEVAVAGHGHRARAVRGVDRLRRADVRGLAAVVGDDEGLVAVREGVAARVAVRDADRAGPLREVAALEDGAKRAALRRVALGVAGAVGAEGRGDDVDRRRRDVVNKGRCFWTFIFFKNLPMMFAKWSE